MCRQLSDGSSNSCHDCSCSRCAAQVLGNTFYVTYGGYFGNEVRHDIVISLHVRDRGFRLTFSWYFFPLFPLLVDSFYVSI